MATTSAPSPSLLEHFDALPDPRLERCRKYQLREIIFLSICAMASGADNFVAIEDFGHERIDWLRRYVELANGIPSHDTIGRVFALIDAEQFIDCFVRWVQSAHEVSAGQIVNIDGKTARASLDRAAGQHPLHVVSAWMSAQRIVLGQVAVDAKSNEIPAIPKLLEMLAIHGPVVTIDAMGCQKEIAAKIRERGADYVLAVKGNQEHLEEDILAHFAAVDEGQCRPRQRSRCEDERGGHGRQEMRFYDAMPVPTTLRHRDDWQDLRSICRATRVWLRLGEAPAWRTGASPSLSPATPIMSR